MKSIRFIGRDKTKAFFTSEDGQTKPQQVLSVAAMLGAAAVAQLVIAKSAYACGTIELRGNECINGSKPCGDGSIYGTFNMQDLNGDGHIDGDDWALYPGSAQEANDLSICQTWCGLSLDEQCDNPAGAEVFCCAAVFP